MGVIWPWLRSRGKKRRESTKLLVRERPREGEGGTWGKGGGGMVGLDASAGYHCSFYSQPIIMPQERGIDSIQRSPSNIFFLEPRSLARARARPLKGETRDGTSGRGRLVNKKLWAFPPPPPPFSSCTFFLASLVWEPPFPTYLYYLEMSKDDGLENCPDAVGVGSHTPSTEGGRGFESDHVCSIVLVN